MSASIDEQIAELEEEIAHLTKMDENTTEVGIMQQLRFERIDKASGYLATLRKYKEITEAPMPEPVTTEPLILTLWRGSSDRTLPQREILGHIDDLLAALRKVGVDKP